MEKMHIDQNKSQEKTDYQKNISEVFSLYPELAQIGSLEQYSEYIKSIFPESKLKEIVYHGTSRNFEEFKRKPGLDDLSGIEGVEDYYFTNNRKLAEFFATKYKKALYAIFKSYETGNIDWYFKRQESAGDFSKFNPETVELWEKIYDEFLYIIKELNSGKELDEVLKEEKIKYFENKQGFGFRFGKMLLPYYLMQDHSFSKEFPDGKVISVLLNLRNAYIKNGTRDSIDGILSEAGYLKKTKDETIDGGIQQDVNEKNIVVFSTEQIHILGSKADAEGFKEFMKSQENK